MDNLSQLNPELVWRIGLTLMHFVWQASLGALVVMAGTAVLRSASALVRYRFQLTVMGLMGASLPVTYCCVVPPAAAVGTLADVQVTLPSSSEHLTGTQGSVDAVERSPTLDEQLAVENLDSAVTSSLVSRADHSDLQAIDDSLVRGMPIGWLVAMYAVGVGLMMSRLFLGQLRSVALRKKADGKTAQQDLLPIVERCAIQLGLKFAPLVAYCDRVAVPMVVGVLRPMVLVPVNLGNHLTGYQLETLLLHELAHIRRWDPLINWLQRTFEAIGFFHPGVWLVSGYLSREREHVADDWVIACGHARARYADTLVQVAELVRAQPVVRVGPFFGVAASGERPSEFKQRVLRLVQHPDQTTTLRRMPGGWLLQLGLMSTCLCLPIAHSAWADVPAPDNPTGRAQERTADTAAAAFQRVLEATSKDQRLAREKELMAFDHQAVQIVVHAAGHQEAHVRREALRLLRDYHAARPEALPVFIRGLEDTDAEIRRICTLQIGAHKLSGAADALRDVLKEDDELRLAAAKSLAELGYPDGLIELYDALGDDSYFRRQLANQGMLALTGKCLNDFGDYHWHEGAFVSGKEIRRVGRHAADAEAKSRRFHALAEFHRWLRGARPGLALQLSPLDADLRQVVEDRSSRHEATAMRSPPTAARQTSSESELKEDGPAVRGPVVQITRHLFRPGDSITIESLIELPADSPERYLVRGRYQLESVAEATLEQWCSNGELKGDRRSLKIQRGAGEFSLRFSIVKPGSLHLSIYPVLTPGSSRVSSIGSLYYAIKGVAAERTSPPPTASSSAVDITNPIQPAWQTKQTEFYHLHYLESHQQDVDQVAGYLDHAVAQATNYFADLPAQQLLRSAQIDVWLYARPNSRASAVQTTLETSTRDGLYHADLHLLTPSSVGQQYRNNLGQPIGSDTIFKTVVHEYVTVLLDLLSGHEPEGWRFFDAPNWFVQGYEEYLGLTLSNSTNLQTLDKYQRLVVGDRERVSERFEVRDPYVDGAVLLHFLHSRFGPAKVRALLVSNAPDFWSAVQAELGCDPGELYEFWQDWASGG